MKKGSAISCSILIFFIVIPVLCGCSKKEMSEQEKESFEKSKKIVKKVGGVEDDLKGIPFDKFWESVKKEAHDWIGNDPYLVKVESFREIGFRASNGSPVAWRAKILKPESKKKSRDFSTGKKTQDFRGKTKYVSMSATRHIKAPEGLHVTEEASFTYRGSAVSLSRVKIGAARAEKIAGNHKNYKPTGHEQFLYGLDVKGDNKDTPVWSVSKVCMSKSIIRDKCDSENNWTLNINAETGEILE